MTTFKIDNKPQTAHASVTNNRLRQPSCEARKPLHLVLKQGALSLYVAISCAIRDAYLSRCRKQRDAGTYNGCHPAANAAIKERQMQTTGLLTHREPLMSMMSAGQTQQTLTKKRRLRVINEHFDALCNAVWPSVIVNQKFHSTVTHPKGDIPQPSANEYLTQALTRAGSAFYQVTSKSQHKACTK